MSRSVLARAGVVAGLLLASALLPLPASAKDTLRVRINDAVVVPGGKLAVVLRTYASRPIGQGQLCLEVSGESGSGSGPVTELDNAEVTSDANDAGTATASNTAATPQTFMVEFDSPSQTINASDGPLAVYYLQTSLALTPGETYALQLDLANSTLRDAAGDLVELEPRDGVLQVRAPDAPIALEADAERVVPGGIARLFVETNELFPISSGRVTLTYDPAIEAGIPEVVMSPRYGDATFTSDVSVPGRVVVDFRSADLSLNRVPGRFIEIRVPTSSGTAPGTLVPLSLEAELFDADSKAVPLQIAGGNVEFVRPSPDEAVTDLALARTPQGTLKLSWTTDCPNGTRYAVYRGNLAAGYASIALEPGHCGDAGPSAEVPLGPGEADFFLVVPVVNGLEGGYGSDSALRSREPPDVSCNPTSDSDDLCSP